MKLKNEQSCASQIIPEILPLVLPSEVEGFH